MTWKIKQDLKHNLSTSYKKDPELPAQINISGPILITIKPGWTAQSFMIRASIHQVVSLLSVLINCGVRGFISSLLCNGPVSVLPRGRKGKVIWGGEPDTPFARRTGSTQTKAPREKDNKDLRPLSCCPARFLKMTPKDGRQCPTTDWMSPN